MELHAHNYLLLIRKKNIPFENITSFYREENSLRATRINRCTHPSCGEAVQRVQYLTVQLSARVWLVDAARIIEKLTKARVLHFKRQLREKRIVHPPLLNTYRCI